jgi:membrane protein YdbS with pleckstrin-like domain
MTRGRPALWSSVLGAPFLALGAYVYAFQSAYPLVADQPTAPPAAGVPLALFGLFVAGLGHYVRLLDAPDGPTMREGERVVAERHPAQRNAVARTLSSVPFLAAGLYLLYFTTHPLVLPTVALAVGLYLFSTGVHEYWRNTLTTYVLTNRRTIEEYRFLSLVRNEVPLGKVRAVRERRSFLDTLFGLGSVRVRAGASGDLSVTVRSVADSTEFADAVRREMDGSGGPDGAGDGAERTEEPRVAPTWEDVEVTEPEGDGEPTARVVHDAADPDATPADPESTNDDGSGPVAATDDRP